MVAKSGEELVLYKAPVWVYLGYLATIAGAGLIMWAGAESKWTLLVIGIVVLVVGSAIVWAQKLHRRSWARKNDLPAT